MSDHKREIAWLSFIFNLQMFFSAIVSVYVMLFSAKWQTFAFAFFLTILGILGQAAGAHRLWAHNSYKASTVLRVFLMLCQSQSGFTSIYNWAKLHRLHHKFHKTELDPYNAGNGFFQTHFMAGNLKLSKAQETELEKIPDEDLEQDGVVRFQRNFYWAIYIIFVLLLPMNAPVEYWGETILNSFFIMIFFRLSVTQQLNNFIYSAVIVFDYSFLSEKQVNSNLIFFIEKSYWISYHYLVPWDCLCGEFGKYENDCTSRFIKVCEVLNLASELKTTDTAMIRSGLKMAIDKPAQVEKNNLIKFVKF